MVGDEGREGSTLFADGECSLTNLTDEHTEELLALHKMEIKRLKEERRMQAPLLARHQG